MPAAPKVKKALRKSDGQNLPNDAAAVVVWLKRNGSKATRDGYARFGLPSDNTLGVTMAQLKVLAKAVGTDHTIAGALWTTGIYEARMAATLIDDPAQVTSAQMDRWCKDFDNWGITDTACFALFDKTAHRWSKVDAWADKKGEFQKRAAFALLWGLTTHDKTAPDAHYLHGLTLIERGSTDERHFVKKAVNMALRAIGKRNRALHAAAISVATRLAASPDATARWIGTDARRELTGPVVARRIAKR
jgi:3-methyladenine DNA glycosylase AlkD